MPPPLHQLISEKLRQQILEGEFQPGAQLPSEHQLIEQFQVSRITIRRAISNLNQQGLVISRRGRGVFVKERQKVTYSLSSPIVFFDQDMARQGFSSSIQNLTFELVLASADTCRKLELLPPAEVFLQKKLLLLDQVPAAVDVTYLLPKFGKTYGDQLKSQMTFPTLEQNGIVVEHISATLECTRADYEASQHLNVPLGEPLLVYCYTAYTQGHQPILYGRAVSRGDRLCYSVEIMKNAL
ncbi:GntR family transcriptional regulator [Romeria aff. gracilis LEGE 07310]|uniref:GntR family transcriptional regulator n=1 Tax=Vasconcelosia minhoensis LEGE 07310 TaxID=915328 RepID=A0A8J7AJW3_9CYAN|nr:GntR family transcriptional regulator [Romeria gracilis]MBE9080426.1 GntR family transcriptional regulator [Romeria aff. gracilis LEGE 07310]